MQKKIGLISVDGHNFPNLALMRISAFHKAQGDEVEWWQGNMFHYDKVYMSKVFSDAYSPPMEDPVNADEVIKGGTGFCISLGADGKEHFDESKNVKLPDEMEKMFPDYSIYPEYPFAVSMTSRGCPRGCAFCHVAAKEGRCSVKVANVSDFWRAGGQTEIKVLDPNITACREKRDLMAQYRETGVWLDFTQGLDIRCLNDADIEDINAMKIKDIHFAWDNPEDELAGKFKWYAENAKHKPHGKYGTVYVLVGFNSTMEQNLRRVYTLHDLGYDPYVMVYDKPHAPKELRRLQRWVNNIRIFWKCKRWEDYGIE